MIRAGLLVVALAVAGVGAAAGCGSNDHAEKSPIVSATAVPVDCSRSVTGRQRSWPSQIGRIASSVLQQDGHFLSGCFGGRAASVDWTLDYSGEDVPDVTGGASARRRWAATWAASLVPLFKRTLQPTGKQGGTNWLGALQASAGIPGIHSVYLFSDLVQQTDSLDLTRPLTATELDAAAAEWAPRLSGLKGLAVYAVGSGQGTQRPVAAQRGRDLLERVATLADFRLRLLTVVAQRPPV